MGGFLTYANPPRVVVGLKPDHDTGTAGTGAWIVSTLGLRGLCCSIAQKNP